MELDHYSLSTNAVLLPFLFDDANVLRLLDRRSESLAVGLESRRTPFFFDGQAFRRCQQRGR